MIGKQIFIIVDGRNKFDQHEPDLDEAIETATEFNRYYPKSGPHRVLILDPETAEVAWDGGE